MLLEQEALGVDLLANLEGKAGAMRSRCGRQYSRLRMLDCSWKLMLSHVLAEFAGLEIAIMRKLLDNCLILLLNVFS